MPCARCRRIRAYVANKAAKALRLGQHQPKVKPSGKVYDRRAGKQEAQREQASAPPPSS